MSFLSIKTVAKDLIPILIDIFRVATIFQKKIPGVFQEFSRSFSEFSRSFVYQLGLKLEQQSYQRNDKDFYKISKLVKLAPSYINYTENMCNRLSQLNLTQRNI